MSDKVIIRLRYGDEQLFRTYSEAVIRALIQPDESHELSLTLISSAKTLFEGQFPQGVAEMWRIAQPHAQSDLQVNLNTGLACWQFGPLPPFEKWQNWNYETCYWSQVSDDHPMDWVHGYPRELEPLRAANPSKATSIALKNAMMRDGLGLSSPLDELYVTTRQSLKVEIRCLSLTEVEIRLESASPYQAFLGYGEEQWWKGRNPQVRQNLAALRQWLETLVTLSDPQELQMFTEGAELYPLESHLAYYANEAVLDTALEQVRRLDLPATEDETGNTWLRHLTRLRAYKLAEARPHFCKRSWDEQTELLRQSGYEMKGNRHEGWWVWGSEYLLNDTLEDGYIALLAGQANFQPLGQQIGFESDITVSASKEYAHNCLFSVNLTPNIRDGYIILIGLWSKQTAMSWSINHWAHLEQFVLIEGWRVVTHYKEILQILDFSYGLMTLWDMPQLQEWLFIDPPEFEALAVSRLWHPPQLDETNQQVHFWACHNIEGGILQGCLTQRGRLVEVDMWLRAHEVMFYFPIISKNYRL